jgi:hypothetical protein
MATPLPREIIDRIIDLIRDKTTPKKQRDATLNSTAHEAWTILFPEPFDPAEAWPLREVRMRKRWRELREQLASDSYQDQIIRVIESQATGERFHWLD